MRVHGDCMAVAWPVHVRTEPAHGIAWPGDLQTWKVRTDSTFLCLDGEWPVHVRKESAHGIVWPGHLKRMHVCACAVATEEWVGWQTRGSSFMHQGTDPPVLSMIIGDCSDAMTCQLPDSPPLYAPPIPAPPACCRTGISQAIL